MPGMHAAHIAAGTPSPRCPTCALLRATERALSQPGAKWTPATGWTDKPITKEPRS